VIICQIKESTNFEKDMLMKIMWCMGAVYNHLHRFS